MVRDTPATQFKDVLLLVILVFEEKGFPWILPGLAATTNLRLSGVDDLITCRCERDSVEYTIIINLTNLASYNGTGWASQE